MSYDLLAALASKPRYGEPCNNCGACCATSQCIVSEAVFGPLPRPSPCPAFDPDGKDTKCGMLAHPARHAPFKVMRYGEEAVRQATLQLIFAGDGCDARFNGEPRDPVAVQRWAKELAKKRTLIDNAKKLWGLDGLGDNNIWK